MAPEKPFTFICGSDDFLVDRLGKARFAAMVGDSQDEFAREVLSGFANNVDEVRSAIYRLRDSVQTVSMFGGGERRVLWFKDVNFLADSVTGRADSTITLVGELQEILAQINPQETALLITAAPVDRRRAFPKWCEKTADFTLIDNKEDGGEAALLGVIRSEAAELGVGITPDASALLLARIGSNTRLIVEELRKLASFAETTDDSVSTSNAGSSASGPNAQTGSAAPSVTIQEAHVAELTPNVAEGEFFETAEAFFSGDLKWTLAALQRHFFAGGDARPILAALQNRNRLLIQIRALIDSGDAQLGRRGLEGLATAKSRYEAKFVGAIEKNSFNLFSQHPFYVGKLASAGGSRHGLPSLRRLIDNQQEFITAFEETISRPREQEQVLAEMATRSLAH